MKKIIISVLLIGSWQIVSAAPNAKVTLIEGSAKVLKQGKPSWRAAKLNMPLQIDDSLKADKESLVEITYQNGAIMRLDELTSCCIKKSSDVSFSTAVPKGNVWVNMKKLTTKKASFEVTTPTAVAAIRGTVFQMQSFSDSSADVAVFNGKVAVGLSDEGKKRAKIPAKKSIGPPQEVPGPTEVPGPFEVTLDQWRTIVAGQRISIRSNGTYATTSFDLQKQLDAFIEKNRTLDASIKGAR
jgi:hypothetical protein